MKTVKANTRAQHETSINVMLDELQKNKVVRQTEVNGEKAYQVIAR